MNKKENLFITSLRLNLNNAQDMEAWNRKIPWMTFSKT